MKRLRSIFPLFLFLVSFTAAVAQNGAALDPAKNADVIKLLRVSGGAELGVQMIDNLIPAFEEAFPQVPEELWESMRQEFSADALIDLMVPIYEKYYTHEEIKELIAFYESPLGKKLVERTPLLMQEAMIVGQKWGQEVTEKILKKLEDEGYSKM